MVIDMARRKRIIKKSKGEMSIHQFRVQEKKAGYASPQAGITKPTQKLETKRTPEELAALSPAQRLRVETGIEPSSIEGAKKLLTQFHKGDKPAEAKAKAKAPPGATEAEIAAQQSLVRPTTLEKVKGIVGKATEGTEFPLDLPGAALARKGITELQRLVDPPGAEAAREKMYAEGIGSLTREEVAAMSDISFRIIGGGNPIKLTGKAATNLIKGATKATPLSNLKKEMDIVSKGMNTKTNQAAAGMSEENIKLAKEVAKEVHKMRVRNIATNTVNAGKTRSWLTRIYESRAVRATLVSGVVVGFIVDKVMDSIGNYVFTGFIKEEAEQSLGLDSSNAINAVEWKIKLGEEVTQEDVDNIQRTLAFEKELLAPGPWGTIIGSAFGTDAVGALKEFFEAATLVNENKQKRFQEILKTFEEFELEEGSPLWGKEWD